MKKESHFNNPYSPQEKLKALKLLKREKSIEFVAHRYHCTIQTIYRWKRHYDGTIESLSNGSHVPLTPNPKAHTEDEIKHIKDMIKRNPNVGLNELYSKLRLNYAYKRNPVSLYRFLKKKGFYEEVRKQQKRINKPYDTPLHIGEKMQLDVKYVPYDCRTKEVPFDKKFYQYTIIDEASRERFLYVYEEQCATNTVDFVRRAIIYFGYVPKIIQTDNGQEFTHIRQTIDDREHLFDKFCRENGIEHKLIKPRTPRHNGKVERSHLNDNERFYKNLKFYSLDDLNLQMKAYVKRSNNICMSSLKTKRNGYVEWLSPIEKRKELLALLEITE